MKIGIIWKEDYPWDVRVEKIARSLHANGHDVCILSGNAQGRARCETFDGIRIRRLPATPVHCVNAIISIPFYLNPFWFRLACETVKREQIELIIVRDLPLILVGLWVKRYFRVPIILDMAENYPAMYRENLDVGGWRAWVNRVAKNPKIMEFVERRTLGLIDHTLVVVEESAQRLIRFGISGERLSVVSNTPRLENLDSPRISGRGPRPWFQLIYTGLVQEARGLDVVACALRLLRDRHLDIRLRIVGDGPYLSRLVEIIRKKGVEDIIEFTGWVSHEELAKYVYEADVGVIPHPKNDHTDTTIPNKLFDYMACGKPVIVSNAAPLERVVTQEDCGLVFRSGSPESLADVLERMSADEAAREKMGQNGAQAVRQRFCWERDAEVLREAVGRFA